MWQTIDFKILERKKPIHTENCQNGTWKCFMDTARGTIFGTYQKKKKTTRSPIRKTG